MPRLFGYFANQSDRIRCALTLEGDGVAVSTALRADGWGVGSYQQREVLLRRTPTEAREHIQVADLVRDLRTDCAVVHVRSATVGSRSLENTHPFRYRNWLFAHTGSIPGFVALRPALVERIPDFLVRNLRGETDSEVLFHLVLGMVHATGRLDDPELDRWAMVTALREAVAVVDGLTDAAGSPRAVLNLVLTNGFAMVALRRGMPMNWVRRSGIRDCAACRKRPDVSGREPRRMDHEGFKYVLVASDPGATPPGWYDVPEGSVVAIDRALDAQVSNL